MRQRRGDAEGGETSGAVGYGGEGAPGAVLLGAGSGGGGLDGRARGRQNRQAANRRQHAARSASGIDSIEATKVGTSAASADGAASRLAIEAAGPPLAGVASGAAVVRAALGAAWLDELGLR